MLFVFLGVVQLSGYGISEEIQNKKDKPLYNHKLEVLEREFKKYQNINNKLDRFILLALNDIKKGHSNKALSKLKKIKQKIKQK